MHSFPYENRPGFGRGSRHTGWLVPLLLGIIIGALFVGALGSSWWSGMGNNGRSGRAGAVAQTGRDQREQAVPPAVTGPSAPRADALGQEAYGDHMGKGRRGFGGFFFPGGLMRLALPLLLIGVGAWLIGRRGSGGSGSAAPPSALQSPGPASNVPVAPVAPEPTTDPSTGETRRL